METTPASPRMFSLLVLQDMHTTYFSRAIEGITDEDAHNRLNTMANHVAWLAGSLVQERYELAKALGIDRRQAAHDLFSNHKGIQDGVTYPSLQTFQKDWDAISPDLRAALTGLSDGRLDELINMPEMSMPFFDLIAFITYREANCIGQIALWRRLMDYPAISYMP